MPLCKAVTKPDASSVAVEVDPLTTLEVHVGLEGVELALFHVSVRVAVEPIVKVGVDNTPDKVDTGIYVVPNIESLRGIFHTVVVSGTTTAVSILKALLPSVLVAVNKS